MSSFQHRAALNVLVLDELAVLGVDAFITTRHGGVSAAPYDSLNVGLHVGDVDDHVIENRIMNPCTGQVIQIGISDDVSR